MIIGHDSHIAYFSMEIGVSHSIPTYAGGLGVLAGDLLKSFADMNTPVIGITLLNSKGYFNQEISNGEQLEHPVEWNPANFMTAMPNIVTVNIEDREVKIRAWKLMVRGNNGYNIPVFFLDSNFDGNSEYDKTLTSYLYGGDRQYRLSQEIILGIGGIRILDALGYNIKKYHMNEGHSALLTIELLKKTYKNTGEHEEDHYDIEQVKDKCVFTTHTPIAAGHDAFDIGLFQKLLKNNIPKFALDKAMHNGMVNMTMLALNFSTYVNGVAKRHGEVTREMFPGYIINEITNGVHPQTWISPAMKNTFDKYVPEWTKDPFTLRYALSIPRDELIEAHMQAKRALIEEVNKLTGINLDPLRFTIGYARRFTEYKRPDLLLNDIAKLKQVADRVGDIQIIYAGKAHVQDYKGKELIKKIIQIAKEINAENSKIKIVFIPNYDMLIARKLVAGCDIWLNTPQRPLEASGTSGMKAALNGVPQASTLDGWWIEGCIENTTGWSLGPHPQDPGFKEDSNMDDESRDLYNKLEFNIIPTFYGNKDKWADIMKHCIAINASFFNSYRMAQQYIANAYADR
ncbi:MAG TPA: alpha-glucan family phosphorylase [Alphaproteobacteria bacterium]|nr:alpha-glucan family phosphorylase [Alphaproteobacteria bacterium]